MFMGLWLIMMIKFKWSLMTYSKTMGPLLVHQPILSWLSTISHLGVAESMIFDFPLGNLLRLGNLCCGTCYDFLGP